MRQNPVGEPTATAALNSGTSRRRSSLCLEFTPDITPLRQPLYDLYSFNLVPLLGRVVAVDREAYAYLV
jgi:ubiquinone/menaquinone biosynthesis C-methylase UbiE